MIEAESEVCYVLGFEVAPCVRGECNVEASKEGTKKEESGTWSGGTMYPSYMKAAS